jgi:dihydroneopterin aldolase
MELGRIRLKDIQFDSIVGILPYERANEQPVILNLTLWLDFAQAAKTEDLNESIDYAKLAEELKRFIRLSRFKLVETLVVKTAEYVLEHYPKANAVEVSVVKPQAIPGCLGAEASVKIRRQ